MRIYFAGVDHRIMREVVEKGGGKNVLTSYWIQKTRDLKVYEPFNLFLDSGAFTAYTKHKVIDLDKYAEFCHREAREGMIYANLDVIGDPVKTEQNQRYLERKGLTPIPVFHNESPLGKLAEMRDEYEYLALGGLVPMSKDPKYMNNWLDRCFRILIPKILGGKLKVHGFGVTNYKLLLKYPFYSVDSTSWLSGEAYGVMVKWDTEKKILKQSIAYKQREASLEHQMPIHLHTHYRARSVYNVEQFLEMEKDITKIWAKRGIVYAE